MYILFYFWYLCVGRIFWYGDDVVFFVKFILYLNNGDSILLVNKFLGLKIFDVEVFEIGEGCEICLEDIRCFFKVWDKLLDFISGCIRILDRCYKFNLVFILYDSSV